MRVWLYLASLYCVTVLTRSDIRSESHYSDRRLEDAERPHPVLGRQSPQPPDGLVKRAFQALEMEEGHAGGRPRPLQRDRGLTPRPICRKLVKGGIVAALWLGVLKGSCTGMAYYTNHVLADTRASWQDALRARPDEAVRLQVFLDELHLHRDRFGDPRAMGELEKRLPRFHENRENIDGMRGLIDKRLKNGLLYNGGKQRNEIREGFKQDIEKSLVKDPKVTGKDERKRKDEREVRDELERKEAASRHSPVLHPGMSGIPVPSHEGPSKATGGAGAPGDRQQMGQPR